MRKPRHTAHTTTTQPPLSVVLHIHDGERSPAWDALWRDWLLPTAQRCPHPGHLEPVPPRLAAGEENGEQHP